MASPARPKRGAEAIRFAKQRILLKKPGNEHVGLDYFYFFILVEPCPFRFDIQLGGTWNWHRLLL